MKLLFDQNISHRILYLLPEQFSGSTSLKKEGLINSSDRDVWQFAKNFNFVIVTQDSDFNNLNLLLGFPPKIIWIRAGNVKTKVLVDILSQRYDEIKSFINDEEYGCFEISSLKKI